MRSALICVFFALIVHKEGSLAADEDFRPTPIPLNEWNGGGGPGSGRRAADEGAVGAGTLHEVLASDAPPVTAAVPAHYWEDALRHSVYLTLVRDKIDQLIAKSSVVTPDAKNGQNELDDHDLWEKIKTAPFDRLTAEEPAYLGDITIMSKGRLLEENDGLRFTEDEISKEKCNEEKCNEGVKAYWAVKRVRQRDTETASGKYHYELTFSVSSQTTKKQIKPYNNHVRTFTIQEGTPVEKPLYRMPEAIPPHAPRPQRAVWFHKNIAPTAPHRGRKEENGLDRFFSSWFSSEEELPPKRYKQVSYVTQMYPQRSKVGHVGAPADQYHQKQLMPYPYKPQPQPQPPSQNSYKYSRPPLGPPPISHPHTQHHYVDVNAIRNQHQYNPPHTEYKPSHIEYKPPQTEYKYVSSNIVKTTKPAVLPTPPLTYGPLNITMELSHNLNVTESTTARDSEIITAFTMYSKPKPQSPTKVSHFPEHVRPPVFNAPPGVFVTMDKKPFKPMPPLKYNMHSFKQNKHKPTDFRPSPQVLDVQFSDPDPLSDAFRPITMGYAGSNTTETGVRTQSDRAKPLRKSKPPKKHDNIKTHRVTTSTPEIITAHNEVLEEMHWANILEAFVKTTPMMSYKIHANETTTTRMPSTTVSSMTTVTSTSSTTEAERTTRTTGKPRRTRPPPKFSKPVKVPVKVKKHKRVTSSTTTTSTTTTTERPHHRRPSQDLTPQASSVATGTTKTGWQPKSKIKNETVLTTPIAPNVTNAFVTSTTHETTTTSKIIPTTYRALTSTRQQTTTTETPSTTKLTTIITTTLQPQSSKNRFRQSTLMTKGTSVNHDKWSSPYLIEKNKTTTERVKLMPPVSGKYPRRKGSNFQGYNSSNPKNVDEERNREDHKDHVFNPNLNVISLSSTSEITTEADSLTTPKPTQATYEESAEENEQSDIDDPSGTEDPDDGDGDETEENEEQNDANDEQQTKDHQEYMFDTTSKAVSQHSKPVDKSNEIEPEIHITTTEETVVTSLHSVSKNKTKCKKKQNNTTIRDHTPKSASDEENEISVAPIATTTERLSSVDFFDQIFGLTVDHNETDHNKTESKYVDNDEDLEEFLKSINRKKESNESNDEEYEEEDKEENENSPFNNDDDNRYPRHADASYEDYQDRPYSFLELMAME